MRDDGPSTDPDLSVPLRSLLSAWERHLLLASCDDMKLPTWDPGTGTKVSSTLSRHVSIDTWPWLCEKGLPLEENPLVLSHHCRGLMHNSPKAVLLDAAAIRPNSLWNCLQWVTGLALYFLQLTGWTLYVPVTGAPASTLSPMPRQEKFVLCSGESTLFLAFSHNPNSFMWARTTSRSRTANWCYWARINQSSM